MKKELKLQLKLFRCLHIIKVVCCALFVQLLLGVPASTMASDSERAFSPSPFLILLAGP